MKLRTKLLRTAALSPAWAVAGAFWLMAWVCHGLARAADWVSDPIFAFADWGTAWLLHWGGWR